MTKGYNLEQKKSVTIFDNNASVSYGEEIMSPEQSLSISNQ